MTASRTGTGAATGTVSSRAARAVALPSGGGEMGERIRVMDWSRTAIGPPVTWPGSLHTALGILINSGYPMYIAWGPQFTQFYNDAYRPILGSTKHPKALGESTATTFAEIWDFIGPMFREVLDTARPSTFTDQLLPLERHGFVEECYFTFSYSAIVDSTGDVGGVFVTVIETTERVLRERRLGALRAMLRDTARDSVDSVCSGAIAAIAGNRGDAPFAAVYERLADGGAELRASVGIEPGGTLLPRQVAANGEMPWFAGGDPDAASAVVELPAPLPPPPGWSGTLPVRHAALARVTPVGGSQPRAWLLVGLSPHLKRDAAVDEYVGAVAGHVAKLLAEAEARLVERRRVEALAEIDRAKTVFFSNVSHEFRTPLTLMLGPLDDLLAAPGDEIGGEARSLIGVVRRNGQRLLKLVNTLLDFARIEAGRAQAVFRPTDVAGFTAELASHFRSACERAGLRLVVDCPPTAEPAYIDGEMWERIVLNLVSNAFKFTTAGEIVVSVEDDDDAFSLVVRDTGCGIAPGDLPRVFERFHRIDGAIGRSHEGSGIGLALVHELVRLHGGTIAATSEPGAGSTFTVRIPKGCSHLPPDQVESAGPAVSPTSSARVAAHVGEALSWAGDTGEPTGPALPTAPAGAARIVLADDNADMRDYLRRLLAEFHEVEVVGDGLAALAAVRERRPELVISDVMMPRLDGISLLRELRADAELRTIPVMLLSARAGEDERARGLDEGADDYLVKPFGSRELLVRVGALLRAARIRREAIELQSRNEERLRSTLAATGTGYWELDLRDQRGAERSPEHDAIFGYTSPPVDWHYEDFLRHVHADDRERVDRAQRAAIVSGHPWEFECRIVRADGAPAWIWARGDVSERDESGAVIRLSGLVRDISDRKQSEEALLDARERLEATLSAAEVGTWTWNATQDRVVADRNLARLFGISPADAAGAPIATYLRSIHPDDIADVERHVAEAMQTGAPFEATYRVGRPGHWRHVIARGHAERGADGAVLRLPGIVLDITEQKRVEGELRRSEEAARRAKQMLDVALAASATGTFQFDVGSCRFISFDDNLKSLFGLPVDLDVEVVDHFLDRVHRDDREAVSAAVERTIGGGLDFEMEFRVVHPDGSVHWLFDRAKVVRDADGRPSYLVGACTDVTRRHDSEAAAHAAAAENERLVRTLREADRRKDDFLATLSHELRNPLAPLRNALVVMSAPNATVQQVDRMREVMKRQIDHLVRLVDDLMEMSRISRDSFELRRERVELAVIVGAAVETSDHLIRRGRHTLTVDLPDAGCALDGDPVRLTQILANLLNNAAKYTPPGGSIRVDARIESGTVDVRVSDDGRGMDEATLARIFQMFSRGDRTAGPSDGGLGIGLALARRLAQMHGGSLEAASAGPGRGSTFTLRLPLPAGVETAGETPAAKSGSVSAISVLVVDDNRDAAESLAMVLEAMGVGVAVAFDGAQALAMFDQRDPQVVLMDIGMPVIDGYEVARRLRCTERGRRSTLVALTGWGQAEDRRRAKEAGFDHHLVKPVDLDRLQQLLATLPSASPVEPATASR